MAGNLPRYRINENDELIPTGVKITNTLSCKHWKKNTARMAVEGKMVKGKFVPHERNNWKKNTARMSVEGKMVKGEFIPRERKNVIGKKGHHCVEVTYSNSREVSTPNNSST